MTEDINDEKFHELRVKLEPIMNDFVRKVQNLGLTTSALIFDAETGFLVRCGNAPAEGRELVRLHYFLSYVAASLEQQGLSERFKLADKGLGPSSDELADTLALTLLQTPSDMIPQPVLDSLMEYVNSRRP